MAQTFTPRPTPFTADLLPTTGVCPLLPGLYYTPALPGFQTTALFQGAVSGARMTVRRLTTVTSLAINVTTAGSAGALIRLGLLKFVWTSTGYTCTLLADGGTVDATTTGAKTVTTAAPVTAGDIIVPVAVLQGAPSSAPSVTTCSGPDSALGFAAVATALGAQLTGLQMSGSWTAGLPTSFTMNVSGSPLPRVAIMAAT